MKVDQRKQFVVLPDNRGESFYASTHLHNGTFKKRAGPNTPRQYVQTIASREIGRELGYCFPDEEPALLEGDDIRQRFWNLLRMKKILTVPGAAATLVDAGDDTRRAQKRLNEYLNVLEKIAYVTCRRGHTNTWLLGVDVGQKAPIVVLRNNCVYDPNVKEWLAWVA